MVLPVHKLHRAGAAAPCRHRELKRNFSHLLRLCLLPDRLVLKRERLFGLWPRRLVQPRLLLCERRLVHRDADRGHLVHAYLQPVFGYNRKPLCELHRARAAAAHSSLQHLCICGSGRNSLLLRLRLRCSARHGSWRRCRPQFGVPILLVVRRPLQRQCVTNLQFQCER